MTTIAASTVPRALCRPRTHTMNPYSPLAARVATIDTGVVTRTTTAIELWQSTINNALAKVFGYAIQSLEGCHPSPLSLNFCFILFAVLRTQDLGRKGWRYYSDFVGSPL